MATASAEQIKEELKQLGERRKALETDEKKLARDVERVLRRAYGKVSVTEAAELLNMHRTTVYRVYHPHNNGRAA